MFDIEVVFIYPWVAKYSDFLKDPAMSAVAFFGMVTFIVVLGLGLLYEWRRGAMEWE